MTIYTSKILSNSSLSLGNGDIADFTEINYAGSMFISSGGTANNTTINSGGDQYISSGGVADTTIINSGGGQYIYSGGVANTTIINSSSFQYIASGGVASNTIINSWGSQSVYSGGVDNNTIIKSGGLQYVARNGVASNTIILSGGSLRLNSGGSSINLTWTPFTGTFDNYGGYATFANPLSGCFYGSGETLFAHVMSMGYRTLTNTSMYVMSGGRADYTVINGGYQEIYSGGIVTSTKVGGYGSQVVQSGGVASHTEVLSGGMLRISSGGSALGVQQYQGGEIRVDVIGGDTKTIISGTNAFGNFSLSGGVANNFIVNGYGFMDVRSGGVANSTIINSMGGLTVFGGGIANGTTINSGCSMGLRSDGLHLGTLRIENGGIVRADAGAGLDFTVAKHQASGDVLVTNYNLISGSDQVNYSITVNNAQKNGIYQLASGASSYAYTATVKNTAGTQLGTLAVGEILTHGNYTYALKLYSGVLSLNIWGEANKVRTDLLSNGHSQVVAWDAAGGKVGYVATDGQAAPAWTGIWEWGSSEAAMWKVVGVGRFSADVEHDGILLYNGIGNTFAAWTDLGRGDYGYVSLCHVDGNFQTLALADFDNNGLDDVIIYDEKGSFGIVSDAAAYHDVWHVDNPETNVQQVIGAGYFGNADGKSDILVKKTDENAYFLWHNQDSTFNTWNWSQTYLGSLDDDWVVAAIGDFQGDGVDDIIMWQKSTGYMYAWEDGKASNQRWVGALDASQWEVAAVGDYNGDGKEDLLLRELVSGWGGVGYWASANASNWTDLNARIETDMESKFVVVA